MTVGLQFKKLDLHIHTKASHDFIGDASPQDIVSEAIRKGLDAIAITDHNTIAWVDSVKEAAKNTSLKVFPGVELSCTGGERGIHIIALFDPAKDSQHLVGFLGDLNISSSEYGRKDCLVNKSVVDVIEIVDQWGGLAILAHANSSKGVLHDMKGEQRTKIIQHPKLLAVEATDFDKPLGQRTIDYLNGKDPTYQRKLAVYQSSDNRCTNGDGHCLDGIGTRHSFFKLDVINLEGLRQCFIHPEARIVIERQEQSYSRILSLRIGDKGFLRNQFFEFHEGLNSIIGGKGVGKSLVVEFLRFGLCDPSSNADLLGDHLRKLDKQFGLSNTVEVMYQLANGAIYQISRTLPRINNTEIIANLHCVNLTSGEEYNGDIKEMCPILGYSQTEVIKISENKDAQLELIDKFIDSDKRLCLKKINDVKSNLRESDRRYANSLQAHLQLQQCRYEIDTIKEKIENIDRALANELFELMKKVEDKKKRLNEWVDQINTLTLKVQDLQSEIASSNYPPTSSEDDVEIVQNIQVFLTAKNLVANTLIKLRADLDGMKNSANSTITGWLPEFESVRVRYEKLITDYGGDQQKNERERQKLELTKSQLENQAQQHQRLADSLDEIRQERENLLNALETSYREYYELRQKKFDEITALSEGKLLLSLEHAQNRRDYEDSIVKLFSGSSSPLSVPQRKQMAEKVSPRRFIELVLNRDANTLGSEGGLSFALAQKVIEKLWSNDDFAEVLALQHNCYPEDVPKIQFRKAEKAFDELNSLSIGQKCTALLIIALVEGRHPVIIDQPEDALDIVSVWEDIAKKLLGRKSQRQFILTTHNSSVAVAADSDQFIILQSDAVEGRITAKGAIDREDVKNSVINHLEGGNEPYNLKRKKYNQDVD